MPKCYYEFMKVLLLSGSIGKKSCTRTLMQYINQLLIDKGIETTWWDLGEKPLPIAVPEFHSRQNEHPEKIVRKFAKSVEEADAFILGSPLYHDSYSGVLKNALDNLPNEAFARKPVGLVSHSSNVRSCVTPCNSLRPVVRSLAGYATHSQVGTTDDDYKDVSGELILQNPKVKQRTADLIEELVNLSQTLKHPA